MGGSIFVVSLLLAFGQPGLSLLNLSRGRPTTSSRFQEGNGPSDLVVDGNDSDKLRDPNNATIPQCLYTIDGQRTAFWQVDLRKEVVIDHVVTVFRKGGNQQTTHQKRRNGYSIFVTTSQTYLPETSYNTCYHDADPGLSAANHENRSCSKKGRYVTLYNQRKTLSGPNYSRNAVLELCEVKVMGCPVSTYGDTCMKNCSVNCINSLCFPGNGTCMQGCIAGYTGTTCQEQCPEGRYGYACLEQCGNCAGGNSCDHVDGGCPARQTYRCAPGWNGRKCKTACANYYYGHDCATKCYNCKGGPCNNVNGACPAGGCRPGYTGIACNTECGNDVYGQDCASECYCKAGTCNHVNGTCPYGGCRPGYTGATCSTACDNDHYGQDCGGECFCKTGTCNNVDGTCPSGGCKPGYTGTTCSTACGIDHYGQDCASECFCRRGTCNHVYGTCPIGGCRPGYWGSRCNTACIRYYYGQSCAKRCYCKNGPCNNVDGTCPVGGCSPGYTGITCNTACGTGHYGQDCASECFCRRGPCNNVNGRCRYRGCRPGYKGIACNTACSRYYYGQNCAKRCRCKNGPCKNVDGTCPAKCGFDHYGQDCASECFCKTGTCNHVTGICRYGGCRPGYTGIRCNIACRNGRFGDNCRNMCGHCKSGSSTCDHIDGSCRGGCESGYKADQCIEVCDSGKYGRNCEDTCGICSNGATCNHIDGTCPTGCGPGKMGDNCNTDCTSGTYGSNCENTCGACKSSRNTCSITDGSCPDGCSAGWQEPLCKTACDNDHYGQDCARKCFCKTGTCNNVHGTCPSDGCRPGYTGTTCSTECIDGRFGDNCENGCGHCKWGSQNCNHIDGTCIRGCMFGYKVDKCMEVCDPGRYGNNCEGNCGSCLNESACHHVNGTCLTGCDPGKKGNRCNNDCDPGTYGPNCESKCGNCKEVRSLCNITDGSCPGGCLEGWQEPQCRNACEHGRYGVNCAEQCGHCRDKQTCNRYNGTCENGCSPGWKEPFCIQECSPGWYGDACQEQCGNCAGGNSCHHVGGECLSGQTFLCDPGWKEGKCKTECSSTEYGSDCSQVCGKCFNSSCESKSGNCTEGCLDGWDGVQCEKLTVIDPSSLTAGLVVTAVVVLFLVVLVVVVVMKKRRRQDPCCSPNHNDHNREQGRNRSVLYDNMAADTNMSGEPNHTDQIMYESNISREDGQQSGVLTENLLQEITRKEECDEFQKDFKEFLAGSQFPCDVAIKAENKIRNRYKTTFPYDHSRVQLDRGQGYINANFIKNLEKTNAYVATQGPKQNTLGDFWRMVWQLKTRKIVMVAKCVELGKPKVEQYWPEPGSPISHGGMKIKCISSKQYAAYKIRELSLENEKTKEKRVICQFHFTKWPDHGTPDVMHFVLFLLHVESVTCELSGPMVVHCSAGVGRTGTFIAVDVLFRNGKVTGRVDIPGFVQSMRQDRMDMVQTQPQYQFIYRALVELFLINNTNLTMDNFGSKCLNSSRLRQEYKKLNGSLPSIPEDQLSDGMMPKNHRKNRDPNILPGRTHRPRLSPQSANKTDYINAVFLPSIQSYEGYIATQWPLSDTADDFWAMIYDYKSTAVAILDSDADPNDPNLIPTKSTISAGLFSVQSAKDPCTEGSITMTEVYLSKAGEEAEHKIKIFRMCDWPHDRETCTEGSVTQMVYASQEWQRNVTSAGPITVVCRNGSSKCGIFCTVANAIENINLMHQHVSVMQVVRQLQIRRPSFISSYDSYVMCNQEVKVHFDSLSEYQNYGGPSVN